MKIIYGSSKVEKQCTSMKSALKLFGGDKLMAEKLLSRISAIGAAETINDIRVIPSFRFHNLSGKLKGNFAIDVKTKADKWRIILIPLDEEEKEFDPCNIDEIAKIVRIVEIKEVSPHYE